MKLARPTLILAAFTAIVLLRGPLGEANAGRRAAAMPAVPPASIARILSAGHHSTMADCLWLQALPDLSRRFGDANESERLAMRRKRAWLDDVVNVVTDLEPGFGTVYSYGSAYFDLIARDHERAIAVLERGVERNPDDLLLRINLGMTVLIHREDRQQALRIFQAVLDHPRCDSWSLALCTKLMVDEREDLAALAHYKRYCASADDATREAAELYLERTRKHIYLRAYREFEERNLRPPRSESELRDPELMAADVMDEVLAAGAIGFDGTLVFDKLFEYELRRFLLAAREWSELFRSDEGRWPSFEELVASQTVVIPRLVVGRKVRLVEGEVVFDDASASGAPN